MNLVKKDITTPLKEKVYNFLIDKNPDTKTQSQQEALGLLVDHLIKTYHFKTIKQDEGLEIWAYSKGIYVSHGKAIIKEWLKFFLENGYNVRFANNIIEHIAASTYILPKDFFKNENTYLLPVQNGLLDLREKKLKPFSPSFTFFTKLPINYNPKSKCLSIIQHLKDVLKDEQDINLFQEALGNCLVKEYKFQKAVIMNGKGRNGKGVTLDLINRLLGAENCASIPLQSLEENQYSESNLFGKLANTSGDLNKTALKSTGKFKQLTGGDLMTADRKFLTPLYFTNYAKFFFACNELPEIYDMSDGLWERWLYFDFPYKFVTKEVYNNSTIEERDFLKIVDPLIKDKLFTTEELEGFLNFALEGFNRLYNNSSFTFSKTMHETKNLWLSQSNSALGFCNKMLERNVTSSITVKDLQEVYYFYCDKNQVSIKTPRELNKAIYETFGVKSQLKKENNESFYVYKGLTFKTNSQAVEHIEVK